MYQTLNVISSPSPNPFLPLDFVKNHLRQDSSVGVIDDTLINLFVMAAARQASNYLKRTLATTQYQLVLDGFNSSFNRTGPLSKFYNTSFGSFELPKPPLVSVDQVTYTGLDNSPVSVSSKSYVYIKGTPGRVSSAYGYYFPWVTNPQIGSVQILYTCGYAVPDPNNGMLGVLPENIIVGILLLTSSYYLNREATTEGTLGVLPFGVKELFDSASRGFYS